MAITECSVCGRKEDSRSMGACTSCGSPICRECAKNKYDLCTDCTDGSDSYDGR